MFHAQTQITAWFLGLVDNAGFTSIGVVVTYDGINDTNGWAEFTSYTDPANASSAVTRPASTAVLHQVNQSPTAR